MKRLLTSIIAAALVLVPQVAQARPQVYTDAEWQNVLNARDAFMQQVQENAQPTTAPVMNTQAVLNSLSTAPQMQEVTESAESIAKRTEALPNQWANIQKQRADKLAESARACMMSSYACVKPEPSLVEVVEQQQQQLNEMQYKLDNMSVFYK